MLHGRDWVGVGGASAEDLAALRAAAPPGLPAQYLDLLTFSDGGEGPLGISPYNLCLDSAKAVTESIGRRNEGRADLQGFLIFGGNGGGEYLAFDLRHGSPWPIVEIDMVAGGPSATMVAPDFDAFVEQIGIEADT